MLQALLDRLRLTYEEDGYDVKDYALKLQERAAIKAEIEQAWQERAAQFQEAQEAMSELDLMDAMDPGETGEGDTE